MFNLFFIYLNSIEKKNPIFVWSFTSDSETCVYKTLIHVLVNILTKTQIESSVLGWIYR